MKKANINFLIKKLKKKSCQGYDSNLEPASVSLYLFFEHTKDLMSGASENYSQSVPDYSRARWNELALSCLVPL